MLTETIQAPVELVPADKYSSALAKENITDKVIADLKAAFLPLKIESVEDKAGYKAVKDARIKTKSVRVLASKICKKGREEAIAEQRGWVAKEKEITAQISEVEEHLEQQEKWFDAEKLRIKQEEEARIAAIKAEQERQEQERIQVRAEHLLVYGITGDYDTLKNSSDEEFEQVVLQAKERYEAEQARLAAIEEARKAEQEAERKRLAEEARIQEERAAAIRAEQEKERQRLAEIAKQQEKEAAAIKAEQQRIEAERREMARQAQLIEEERLAAQRKAELEQAKKEAAERAILEAQEQQRREAAAKIEQERLAKIEAERLEALKPDKEKLIGLINTLANIDYPELATPEATKVLTGVIERIGNIQDYLTSQCASLK